MPESIEQLPLFPLNTVLFPGSRLALRVFEPRYLDMVTDAFKRERPFGIALIRRGAEVGEPAEPFDVGTLAHIVNWDMPEQGILQIEVQGGRRFRLERRSLRGQLVLADVALLPGEPATPLPDDLQDLGIFLAEICREFGPAVLGDRAHLDDAGWVGMRLAQLLPIDNRDKQELLELQDPLARLDRLREILRHPPV